MSFKSGFIGIIGRPNVGKSTLLNFICGEKVAITSSKPQTTRNIIRAILTTDKYQMIFLDTPGIHSPRTKLGKYMVNAASSTLRDVDGIVFMIEANDLSPRRGNMEIAAMLNELEIPVFLAINKIDRVPKDQILKVIDSHKDLVDFKSIIPISAAKGDGIDLLLKDLQDLLTEGPKYYPEDMITDQLERDIVAEIIREKVLVSTNEEVPHGTGVEIIEFIEPDEGREILEINATIYCEKNTHKGILIGKKGAMLKKIGSLARTDIERLLGVKVYLQLWVKVKADWRNKDMMLKTLGYSE